MGSGVTAEERGVVAPAEDMSAAHHDSSHRHLSLAFGQPGQPQGLCHEELVAHFPLFSLDHVPARKSQPR